MINVLLSGACGRMGRAITDLAGKTDGIQIVCGYDICKGDAPGYPVYDSFDEIKEQIDVLIDFSNPSNFENVLGFAKKQKLPCIVATTGLSSEQKKKLNEAAKEIPVFFSANMSLGVNLITALAVKAAEILEDGFDIEIIEKHHNQKLDAPSGTALSIADAISEAVKNPLVYVYDRHSVRKKRDKNEIGIHAVRGGNIVGDHSVLFAGNNEVIEINHHAASRDVFADGAVRAAQFMYKKPAGMYNMNDLFGNI